MTQMISAEGDLRAQLFAILTPAQRTQLAAIEAKMHARMHEHMGHKPPPDAPQE